jgi:hypothetical protein
MEYLDLSSYGYLSFPIPMRTVGWLGPQHGLQGDQNPLTDADVNRLRMASRLVSSLTLGKHACGFCRQERAIEGNGEYHYYVPDGLTFSAPVMVIHYVEKHGYRPPQEFLDRLVSVGDLSWDWRAERLVGLLLDATEDEESRCAAIVDLAHWRDPRTMGALLRVAGDEQIVDIAGCDLGRAIGSLLSCDFARNLRMESLPDVVRYGIGLVWEVQPGERRGYP